MDLSVLRRTAAEIAAAAVYESYPNVDLLGGGETSTGFSYEFFTPHPIQIQVIEERMRQIVREKRPIRTLEMISYSAGELLRSKGHHARAEVLEEGLIELIQIGDFQDLCPGPHLKNSAELAAFKITLETLPEGLYRINGWCDTSKEGLKKFLKKLNEYTEPAELGEKMGLWKGDVWLPQGLKMRQHLTQFLKNKWFKDALEISGPPEADHFAIHKSMGKSKVAEIWTDPQGQTHILISFFNKPEEEVISSLHSIGKTLTILSFNHSTVSKGQETDYLVEDGLGRSLPVVHLKRISRKGTPVVDFYFTAVVERIFELLLEKNLVLQMVELENK